LDWSALQGLPVANNRTFPANWGTLSQLEQDAWLIRNAVSIAYGIVDYDGGRTGERAREVDFNDYLYKGFTASDNLTIDELRYSPNGALPLWLGGFPDVDGKLSGFFADPENPFIRTPNPTFDKKTFIDLEIGKNVHFGIAQTMVFDHTLPPEKQVWNSRYSYAYLIIGNEINGTFAPIVYFRGRADGGDGAYKVGSKIKSLAPPKYLNAPATLTFTDMCVPYIESESSAGIKWKNPQTYQLIHPGLDTKFGDPKIVERIIKTGSGIGSADLDNITNFSDYKELKSILP
jgi:hypothetical protein